MKKHNLKLNVDFIGEHSKYFRNALVLASIGEYNEYEHLETILTDAVSIKKILNGETKYQTIKEYNVGDEKGISFIPDAIHIMHKEFTSNIYEGYILKNNNVEFAGGEFECNITDLVPNSHVDEEGYLVDEKGKKYDLTDAKVKVEVGLKDIEIIDNFEDGVVSGEIISIIYKGDHYQIIVRTEDYEDFVIDTEWTWNEFDKVSVVIPKDKIKLTLKGEIKEYEVI